MKTKILLTTTILITLFTACGTSKKTTNSATYDEGVVINGVRWATRNVDEPGTFASTPESAGKLYQWGRKMAWNTTDERAGIGWSLSTGKHPLFSKKPPKKPKWKKTNDPSPTGWRIPTIKEINSLFDENKVSNEWVTQNGINGRKFTDISNGNTIFLPAVGTRDIGGKLRRDVNITGNYWSSTPLNVFIYYYGCSKDRCHTTVCYNTFGFSLRCVK